MKHVLVIPSIAVADGELERLVHRQSAGDDAHLHLVALAGGVGVAADADLRAGGAFAAEGDDLDDVVVEADFARHVGERIGELVVRHVGVDDIEPPVVGQRAAGLGTPDDHQHLEPARRRKLVEHALNFIGKSRQIAGLARNRAGDLHGQRQRRVGGEAHRLAADVVIAILQPAAEILHHDAVVRDAEAAFLDRHPRAQIGERQRQRGVLHRQFREIADLRVRVVAQSHAAELARRIAPRPPLAVDPRQHPGIRPVEGKAFESNIHVEAAQVQRAVQRQGGIVADSPLTDGEAVSAALLRVAGEVAVDAKVRHLPVPAVFDFAQQQFAVAHKHIGQPAFPLSRVGGAFLAEILQHLEVDLSAVEVLDQAEAGMEKRQRAGLEPALKDAEQIVADDQFVGVEELGLVAFEAGDAERDAAQRNGAVETDGGGFDADLDAEQRREQLGRTARHAPGLYHIRQRSRQQQDQTQRRQRQPATTAMTRDPGFEVSIHECPVGGSHATAQLEYSSDPTERHGPDRNANMELKPTVTYDDFAKLDLRVATILTAEPHPNADRLVKLQIDLGFEQRQICAGIRQYYPPETLVGRQIIVIANLAPRTIRGEVSNGMLLAASAREGEQVTDVVVLAPGKPVPPGSTVG
ncbi:MAG: methionine--tRNA ligase subunit beta [Phycisphaeraceae bacterium]|nr:methionine--tRNA ligase subunit beta [Phycisphaeraceae bacterium]